jgi:hypothetical protein
VVAVDSIGAVLVEGSNEVDVVAALLHGK